MQSSNAKSPPNMPNQTTSHIYKLLKRQPSTSSRISSRTPTCKQVSGNAVQQPSGRLINDITTAFQRKGKFGAGFIDLTDDHDTVWYRGLYLKLLKTVADVSLEKFIVLLIQGRSFHIQWDLQQKGSVLAPVLFNIYTADVPHGDSSQYTYADDTGRCWEVFLGHRVHPTERPCHPELLLPTMAPQTLSNPRLRVSAPYSIWQTDIKIIR